MNKQDDIKNMLTRLLYILDIHLRSSGITIHTIGEMKYRRYDTLEIDFKIDTYADGSFPDRHPCMIEYNKESINSTNSITIVVYDNDLANSVSFPFSALFHYALVEITEGFKTILDFAEFIKDMNDEELELYYRMG